MLDLSLFDCWSCMVFFSLYFSILHHFLLSLPLQDACLLLKKIYCIALYCIVLYCVYVCMCVYKCVGTHVEARGRQWLLPPLLSTLLFGTVSHWTLAKEFSRLCLSLFAEQVGHSHSTSFGFSYVCWGSEVGSHSKRLFSQINSLAVGQVFCCCCCCFSSLYSSSVIC